MIVSLAHARVAFSANAFNESLAVDREYNKINGYPLVWELTSKKNIKCYFFVLFFLGIAKSKAVIF